MKCTRSPRPVDRGRPQCPVSYPDNNSASRLFPRIRTCSAQINRPIVLLRPGHEVRGIPVVRSCKKYCFLFFSEALSLPSMALNDCYFFIILENHSRCLVMCSSNVGTGESPDLSDFHPCRSRRSLAIAPGQSSRPELRNGDLQEEQSISRWKKMPVWIIKGRMERQASVFKKKSASPSGVIFETGSVHRLVGYVSPLSVRQIHKSRIKPKKQPITEPTQESNFVLFLFFFFFTFLLARFNRDNNNKKTNKKKTAAQF